MLDENERQLQQRREDEARVRVKAESRTASFAWGLCCSFSLMLGGYLAAAKILPEALAAIGTDPWGREVKYAVFLALVLCIFACQIIGCIYLFITGRRMRHWLFTQSKIEEWNKPGYSNEYFYSCSKCGHSRRGISLNDPCPECGR